MTLPIADLTQRCRAETRSQPADAERKNETFVSAWHPLVLNVRSRFRMLPLENYCFWTAFWFEPGDLQLRPEISGCDPAQ